MIDNTEFTEIILNNKTVYFSEEVLNEPEKYPLILFMTSAGVRWFTVDFEKYPIDNLQDALKKKFYISAYTTWEDSLIYLKNIVSFFNQEDKKPNYVTYELLKNNISIAVLRDFIGGDTNFLFTYLSKTKYEEIDFIFISGLISISFEANFPTNLTVQLFKKALDIQGEEFRIDWHTIIFALAANYPDKGKEVINHLIVDLEFQYEQLIGQTIGGVCSTSLIENIEFFKGLYREEKFQSWVLWGMTRIEKTLSEEDSFKMLDLAEANFMTISVLESLMRFYIITWGYNVINEKVSLCCFEGIKQLLNQENSNVLSSFLNNTTYNSKLPEEDVCELLKVFLKNPNHPVGVFSANGSNICIFDSCVKQNIKTPKYFFEILLSFINNTPQIFSIDVFSQSLPNILKEYPKESMTFILNCLIDYRGKVRHLGHTLLEQESKFNPDIRFGEELKELTTEQQTILVLSVSIPQTLIFSTLFCFIAPLLNLNDDYVSTLIIKVLLKNALQKGGLTDVIKNELVESETKVLMLNLLNQMDERNQEIYSKKIGLKEFNPVHSQRKNLEYYNKLFRETLNKQFQKMWEEEPFGKIFGNNIILLKGGGFKSEHNDKFSPLSNIQSSISIPHSAFLDSEKQLFDTNYYFITNWQNSNDWKEWLRKF